jgi:hypothetical protein
VWIFAHVGTRQCPLTPADALSVPLLHHNTKDPVSIFIDAVRTITRQLSDTGCPVLNDEIGDIIIIGLHKLFVPIHSALLAQNSVLLAQNSVLLAQNSVLLAQKTQPTLTEIIDAVEAFEASECMTTCAHLESTISPGDKKRPR